MYSSVKKPLKSLDFRVTRITYHPIINYSYNVNGETFKSDRKSFGQHKFAEGYYESSTKPQEIVNRYPLGMKIKVSYNPISPNKCFLEPGLGEKPILPPLIHLSLFGISILLLIIALII